MKKILLIILAVLLLAGCAPKQSDIEILNEVMNTIDLPLETKEDLELPSTYTYEEKIITATWNSSNVDALSNEGKVFRGKDDQVITLSLSLQLNEDTITNTFDITILALEKEVIANQILDLIQIPSEASEDFVLASFVKFDDNNYKVNWESSNEDVVTTKGLITYQPEDTEITLTATISYDKVKYSKEFKVIVKAFDTTEMKNYLDSLSIPSEISEKIDLPTSYKSSNNTYTISWESNNEDILSNKGEIGISLKDTAVTLTAYIKIDNVTLSKNFEIKVLKSSNDQVLEILNNSIRVQKMANSDIYLPTNLGNNITCSWTSSNENILSNDGKIKTTVNGPQEVILTANIKIGEETMTKEYKIIVNKTDHFYLTDKFEGTMENVHLSDDGRIVLNDNAVVGTYYSEENNHRPFYEAVASWGAVTTKDATCELFVSIKVGDTYSDYISYGEWGLGLQNKCVGQKNNLIRLVEDEIKVLNSKEATGFKYKFVLRRTDAKTPSPEVFLIAFSFNMNNYSYSVDKSLLKDSVRYDVPQLYQHDVPGIGSIICSATSSTMLLKYKGHDFSKINVLEHEYIAGLVKDYGNNIYGNWVYNCVGMSAFNEFAYVKRFADTYEFLYSLQEVGPMAASIKGTVKYVKTVNGQSGSYTTAGHLLVVTGYEITDAGTFIYINDPNVNTVSIKVTLQDFLDIWRNVSYIVE